MIIILLINPYSSTLCIVYQLAPDNRTGYRLFCRDICLMASTGMIIVAMAMPATATTAATTFMAMPATAATAGRYVANFSKIAGL